MTIETETIRAASEQDLPELFALIRAIYESTNMMCEQFSEKYPDISDLRNEFLELNSIPGSIYLLSKDSGRLTGYLTVTPLRPAKLAHTAHLNMGVSPESRGKSIGKKLLKKALQILKEQKIIEILYLHVRQDNDNAVKLYKSFDFETISVLERDTKIDNEYFNALMMRLFIAV